MAIGNRHNIFRILSTHLASESQRSLRKINRKKTKPKKITPNLLEVQNKKKNIQPGKVKHYLQEKITIIMANYSTERKMEF